VGFLIWILNLFLFVLSALLILLVLIQKGKGGGLAGALGGIGGSSPFGSRAGDTFTRVTIYVAVLWFFLIMLQVRFIQADALQRYQEGPVAGYGTRE